MANSSTVPTNQLTGILLTAVLFTACILTSAFLPSFAAKDISLQTVFFISRLLFWLCILLIYLYYARVQKQPLLLWNEEKHSIKFYFFSLIALLLVVIAGSAIIRIIAHIYGLYTQRSVIEQSLTNFGAPLKLFIVITAAFIEEMIFRGYLMPRIQLFVKGKWWPLVISALAFGLAHSHYGTFVNIAGATFIGFVFGWHYQKYRNIKVLIACHFLIDFVALFLISK